MPLTIVPVIRLVSLVFQPLTGTVTDCLNFQGNFKRLLLSKHKLNLHSHPEMSLDAVFMCRCSNFRPTYNEGQFWKFSIRSFLAKVYKAKRYVVCRHLFTCLQTVQELLITHCMLSLGCSLIPLLRSGETTSAMKTQISFEEPYYVERRLLTQLTQVKSKYVCTYPKEVLQYF